MPKKPGKPTFDDFDDDDDLGSPPPRKSAAELAGVSAEGSEDPLWLIYKINPILPFRVKVEKLVLGWKMDAGELASILHEERSRCQDAITELEDKWMNLGAGLTEEDRQRERGRMIASLQDLRAQVENLNELDPDYKHLQLQMTLLERIAKLRGIEMEKKEAPKDEAGVDPVEQAINSMAADKLKLLHDRLQAGKPEVPEASS